MSEECLICKAPIEYLETDTMMECVICHKKENSKTRCVKGHYVCSECHTSGTDEIIALCLNENVEMEIDEIKCSRSLMNNQCIEERCPFNVKN